MLYYFSGPLFTTAEREFNAQLVSLLRKRGLNIWLCQENTSIMTAKDMFETCLKGLAESDAVIAIMDGPDPDSGSCFECGYAYAMKKPIYTVRTDFRKSGDSFDERFNLMLTESSYVVPIKNMPSTEEVADAIIKAVENYTMEYS